MSLIIGVAIGILIFFFLKQFYIIGSFASGAIAGYFSGGIVKGTIAGILTVLIGTLLFSASIITTKSIVGDISAFASVTGLSVSQISGSFFQVLQNLLSIPSFFAATVAGFIGGILRR